MSTLRYNWKHKGLVVILIFLGLVIFYGLSFFLYQYYDSNDYEQFIFFQGEKPSNIKILLSGFSSPITILSSLTIAVLATAISFQIFYRNIRRNSFGALALRAVLISLIVAFLYFIWNFILRLSQPETASFEEWNELKWQLPSLFILISVFVIILMSMLRAPQAE